MPVRRLYALPFFDDDLQGEAINAQRRQARQGQLTTGSPQVRFIASEPGERRLRGHFDGLYADVMASEMRELLASGDISEVPYYQINDTVPWEGYYAPSSTQDADRADPTIATVQSFEGTLDFKGTNYSHVREVKIAPEAVTNPHGSTTAETVFLANTSGRPRWVDQDGERIEAASVVATHAGERIDFDEFNATASTFAGNESYSLVYDIDYDDEWQTDPVVWDDYNRSKAITTANTTVDPTWARVYDPGHAYNGTRRIDTGRMRVIANVTDKDYISQEWNDTSSQYETVTLGTPSDWQLLDYDIRRIGTERVTARTTWENSSDTTSTYELEAEIIRGQNRTLFYEPTNAGSSTPSGLSTLLDPVALDTDRALGEEASIRERSDLPDE